MVVDHLLLIIIFFETPTPQKSELNWTEQTRNGQMHERADKISDTFFYNVCPYLFVWEIECSSDA
jgi:hypothetical protein